MTDITALAQRMKAKAVDAKSTDDWGCDSDNFHDVATPDNVLALVEALEKAQSKATQQGNIACELFDEVTQLRRSADDKAPELRAQLIEADSELEKAATEPVAWTDEQELRDVERNGCGYLFTVNPVTPHADPLRVIKLYTLPPALESRTVTVKLAADRSAESEISGYDGTEFYRDGWNARGKADRDALVAAGINVEAE